MWLVEVRILIRILILKKWEVGDSNKSNHLSRIQSIISSSRTQEGFKSYESKMSFSRKEKHWVFKIFEIFFPKKKALHYTMRYLIILLSVQSKLKCWQALSKVSLKESKDIRWVSDLISTAESWKHGTITLRPWPPLVLWHTKPFIWTCFQFFYLFF